MGIIKADSWITLGIVAALLIAGGLFWYMPQGDELEAAKTAINKQQSKLELDTVKAAVVPVLVERIEDLKTQYADFDKTMPESKELAGFLKEISHILASEQIANQSIEPGDPVREELYHTLPIIMKFEGSYLSLASLLERIDGMERLTRVQKMDVKSNAENDTVAIELHMNIYFAQG